MSEADEVIVLDTGSDDQTVSFLREAGAKVVTEEISPWRFDTARNRSLDLVPEDADICVCTDLDEVFQPGWRKLLEDAWEEGCSQASYRRALSFGLKKSMPVTVFAGYILSMKFCSGSAKECPEKQSRLTVCS